MFQTCFDKFFISILRYRERFQKYFNSHRLRAHLSYHISILRRFIRVILIMTKSFWLWRVILCVRLLMFLLLLFYDVGINRVQSVHTIFCKHISLAISILLSNFITGAVFYIIDMTQLWSVRKIDLFCYVFLSHIIYCSRVQSREPGMTIGNSTATFHLSWS